MGTALPVAASPICQRGQTLARTVRPRASAFSEREREAMKRFMRLVAKK